MRDIPVTYHCSRCGYVIEFVPGRTNSGRPAYWRLIGEVMGARWCRGIAGQIHDPDMPPDLTDTEAVSLWLTR